MVGANRRFRAIGRAPRPSLHFAAPRLQDRFTSCCRLASYSGVGCSRRGRRGGNGNEAHCSRRDSACDLHGSFSLVCFASRRVVSAGSASRFSRES
jgi:hypothetical protein